MPLRFNLMSTKIMWILDFNPVNATEEEINNSLMNYPLGNCAESFGCQHLVIIKIKESGELREMYRKTK